MDSLRSSSPVKPRCFFKIIVSPVTPHSTLTIPRKFIACGYDLADTVFLKAPASSVWAVDLERTSGEAMLRSGWPEFAAYYSICIGHILVFKYEGNSHFHVTIFDKSATEIEYPMSTSHSEQANRTRRFQKRKELATTDDYVEILGKSRNCHPAKDTSSGKYSMPSNKKKIVSACAEASHQVGRREHKEQKHAWFTLKERTKIKGTDKSDGTCNLKVHIKSEDLHSDGSRRKDTGRGSSSCNIFHNLQFHHHLFSKTLYADEIEPAGIKKPNTVIPSQANGIQHKRIKLVKVEVDLDKPRHHVITAKGATKSAFEEGKARALALAKAFKSNKPSFILKVQPSHVDGKKRGVHVTTAFKETYKDWKQSERVILQIAERTWVADCSWTSIGYSLYKGWYEFARDTSLTEGDVCVFELVNPFKKLFEVVIYRANGKNENC